MKISGILDIENKNSGKIFLHKEGLFYRAYEKSAFLFVQHIKEYSISKKYYKNVNAEVVYCGFPGNTLNEILKLAKNKTISKNDKQITISGFELNKQEFKLWKDNIEIVKNEKDQTGFENLSGLSDKIRNFRVANKTPIECQQFLIELQNELAR